MVPTVERLAVVDLPDPSFVLWSRNGSLLYAVLESEPTRVVAVRVNADGDEARIVGDVAVEGRGGCHLSYGSDPSTLVIAQYGAGTVATVRLDAEGVPVEQIDLDDHHDHSDGAAPHPHQVVALPGTELLAVPDLGLDRVLLVPTEPRRHDRHRRGDPAAQRQRPAAPRPGRRVRAAPHLLRALGHGRHRRP